MVVYPYNHRAKAGLWFTAATHHKSTVPHYHQPRKRQNSKFKAQYPLVCINFTLYSPKILS